MDTKTILYYPVLDLNREKAKAIETQILENQYPNIVSQEADANMILVGGGDGFMLDMLKRHYDFTIPSEQNKIFLGVNCGTLGFLLNEITIADLPSTFNQLDLVKAYMIKVELTKNDNTKQTTYAINDIVVGGNILDYFKFSVESQHLKSTFHGTGVIVSTAMGSSAYRLNNGGPMIPSGSQVWGVSGVASLPFGYKIIRPEPIHITVRGRSPVIVGVDGYAGKFDDVKELTISPTNQYVTIAFPKGTKFDTKRMLLAEEKLLKDDF